MQDIAKYSFRSSLEDSASARNRFSSISQMIDEWLTSKGVENLSLEKGKFSSRKQGSSGYFTQVHIKNEIGELRETLLIDLVKGEYAFTTSLKIGIFGHDVIVYCSMSISRLLNVLAPIKVYPRCPRVIREIIEKFSDWTMDGDAVPSAHADSSTGEDSGHRLCLSLQDERRKFPIIVVSDDPDERPWGDLSSRLANDLVGLAHVVTVDEEGSWALTDELGKSNSCYLGAVRLYWPIVGERLNTSVWTAPRLRSEYGVEESGLNKFLSEIREKILDISTLSLETPQNIREISKHELRRRLSAANAEEQEKQLNSIIDENSDLSEKLEQANTEILRLKSKLAYVSRMQDEQSKEETIQPQDIEPNHVQAANGDLRFYKKIGKKGDADELVITNSCNHNSWAPAHKAIQAQKGVQKLEGRSDWRAFYHCSTCTGGGRWKVQW